MIFTEEDLQKIKQIDIDYSKITQALSKLIYELHSDSKIDSALRKELSSTIALLMALSFNLDESLVKEQFNIFINRVKKKGS